VVGSRRYDEIFNNFVLACVLLGLWQVSGVRGAAEISLETEDVSYQNPPNKNPPQLPKSRVADDSEIVRDY